MSVTPSKTLRSRRAWYLTLNTVVFAWAVAAGAAAVHAAITGAQAWLTVHLLLLGAISTAVIVWSQHFADTLTRRSVARPHLAARLAVHTVGALAVVAGAELAVPPLVIAGAALVVLGAILHLVSFLMQVHASLPSRFRPLVAYYLVAAALLTGGVTVGVLLWLGQTPLDPARLYFAHLAFNLGGWIGITVAGTLILLWPTVLHARIPRGADRSARYALAALTLGVLVGAASSLLGSRVGLVGATALYLAGLGAILVALAREARQAPPRSAAAWSMGAAVVWMLGSLVAFGVLVAVSDDWREAMSATRALLVPFALGFAAQLVVGALTHLLPVVGGGGPAASRAAGRVVERFGPFRVLVVNGALLVSVLPTPDPVRVALIAAACLALLSIIPLGFTAVAAARRTAGTTAAERPRDAASDTPRRLHSSSGGVMTGAGAIVVIAALALALSPSGGSTGSAPAPEHHETTTVTMVMKDMRFVPDTVRVPAGNRLIIKLTNDDPMVHDLTLADGTGSGRLVAGASATVDVGVVDHDIDGWCSVTGHRQLGMVMRILATEGSAAPPMTHHTMPGSGEADGPSAAGDIDLGVSPPADFTARDPALAPAGDATTHRRTFVVTDEKIEVAPGVTQTLWTYNGTAPGPTLRGKVGDRFVITLVNKGDMGHSIDFHAGELAPDGPMRTIAPGESLTYSFTATHSGMWLYHCASMPMSSHIANGMYGVVIIDPPGMDHVDREFVFVQGEYYLGPEGGTVDPSRVATQDPDLVVFNGYADQYRYRPIDVRAGERVRVWVLDAGPNRPTSFHIIGTQFDTVYREGDYRLRDGGSTGTGASQALGLEPAQGGFVELTFPEPGNYPFVSHIMSDAEKGASGLFHVTG